MEDIPPMTGSRPGRRTCGFRLSLADVFILAAGAAASAGWWFYIGETALLIPFVVGHYFLFCNVFRVRRKPELIWAAVFLLNCVAWAAVGYLSLPGIGGLQLVVTVAIIICEIRSDTYHGILARKINPRIEEYLAGRIS